MLSLLVVGGASFASSASLPSFGLLCLVGDCCFQSLRMSQPLVGYFSSFSFVWLFISSCLISMN